jgi:hypothetical protein
VTTNFDEMSHSLLPMAMAKEEDRAASSSSIKLSPTQTHLAGRIPMGLEFALSELCSESTQN